LYRSTTNIFARCEDDDESMMMMSVLWTCCSIYNLLKPFSLFETVPVRVCW
jgi:hypothetical protein